MILLGGGSMESSIRKTLREGGVIERVSFGGQVAQCDLPRWYCQSDIYISPSHVDGTSVSLLEAMACGLPCLVSDIPGNMDWVAEGVNGWTFRDGDVDDLTEKILFAIRNRESLQNVGDASRRTAVARADWKKNFGTLLEAYHAIAVDRDRKEP
jgi:glycosyltransferase involved in cell wall biosynthesis